MRTRHLSSLVVLLLSVGSAALAPAAAQRHPKPKRPPRNAVVLFNGTDSGAWEHRGGAGACRWTIVDGALEVKSGTGDIQTREKFGDAVYHVEFMIPLLPNARDQARGNSGVYLQSQYEIQVLDSHENPTYKAGSCGSIYGQKEPDRNMARPPQEWQTYDITFRAPRFGSDGQMRERPRVTVVWNGVKVHDDVEITIGPTTSSVGGPPVAAGPLLLQDHGCAVRYRNVWVRPLKLK